MKSKLILGVVVCVMAASTLPVQSSASPQFLEYEGRNAIHEGQGGEKKTVDGIEFWMNGDPPHRFKVLGSLTDRRFTSGLIGMMRMSGLDHEIAHAAKEAGGDGVILTSASDDVIAVGGFGSSSVYGGAGRGSFWGSGLSSSYEAPWKEHNSHFVVVKYLADDTADAAAPQLAVKLPAPEDPSLPPAAPPVAVEPQDPAPPTRSQQPTQPRCGMVQQRDGTMKLVPC